MSFISGAWISTGIAYLPSLYYLTLISPVLKLSIMPSAARGCQSKLLNCIIFSVQCAILARKWWIDPHMTSDLTPDPPKILRGLSSVSDVSLVKIGAGVCRGSWLIAFLAFVTNGLTNPLTQQLTQGHDDMLDCASKLVLYCTGFKSIMRITIIPHHGLIINLYFVY